MVEDAGTFAGNATKKAVALAKWLGDGSAPDHAPSSPSAEIERLCSRTIPAWKWMP